MARGGVSPPPNPLPKVSFVKIQDEFSSYPAGVHDLQARSYGYNDFSDFKRPEHYIRYIEPLEIELAEQVEYDMDEQDQQWVEAINSERKKQQMDSVSYEVLEIVMDRLEKEWFDLTKNIPKPDMALPSEDSTCAICDDSEGENTNAIVFCDGCNLAVHQDCYGVPYIPEGQWLCRKCTVSPENPVSCILCPNEGGAFKQTVHGDWVHLLCAIWVPETRVANDVFMEPITGIEKISKQRWRLKCSICEVREGACIQCTKASCFLAFHATCARKEKLLMPMKATQGSEAPTLACYCEKHLPKEQQDARIAALAAEREADDEAADEKNPSPKSSKTARAYAKTYKPGPPLVPHIIVERILQYIGKINIRHRREFVLLACKYWSLKREARRGAAFLKRLHLEPWTASAGGRQQTDEEKTIKLEYMKRLRQDLESVRKIAEMCRKREAYKLEQAEAVQDVFRKFLFGHEPPLRMAFERIMGADRNEFFKNPVSKVDVPDYYDIITHPMSWSVIDRKLDAHEYLDLQHFKEDINLVVKNAMIYNKPTTPFYKAAQKIQATAEPILAELDKIAARQDTDVASADNGKEPLSSAVGDLEPPLALLELLLSSDAIKNDIELILDKDPLTSLFSYELPKIKPPPPPPPPKVKRDRKADLARKRQERLDSSPGFRGPRTRRAAVVYAQFEAEASVPSESPATALEREAGPSTAQAVTEETPSAKSSRKSKRAAAPTTTQAELPPMVEHVDNQQSFHLFEKGWILPPDQKRGNRPRQVDPPAKKKAKTGRSRSHVPALPTTAEDSEPLRATPPPEHSLSGVAGPSSSLSEPFIPLSAEQAPDHPAPVPVNIQSEDLSPEPTRDDEPMEVEQPTVEVPLDIPQEISAEVEVESSEPPVQPTGPIVIDVLDTPATRREKNLRRKAEKVRMTMQIDPPGANADPGPSKASTTNVEEQTERKVIIIEELDTPATRKEKNLRRKAEKARLAAQAAATAPAVRPTAETTIREPPTNDSELQDDVDMHSDLSSLSDLSDEGEEDDHGTNAASLPSRSNRPSKTGAGPRQSQSVKPIEHEPGVVVLPEGKTLEGGTLAWAKADSFPWWPAVIFEPDDPAIPKDVLRARKIRDINGPIHLVRFYDNRNSWQWVSLDKLRMLGEDEKFDQEMLMGCKMQRFKSSKIRNECREAYRRAMAEKETDGNGDDDIEEFGDAVEAETHSADLDVEPPAESKNIAIELDLPLEASSPMTEIDTH